MLIQNYFILIKAIYALCQSSQSKIQNQLNRFGISLEVLGFEDTMQFMIYIFKQMQGTGCITIVSDRDLGFMTGSLMDCSFDLSNFCYAYKYQIQYEGGVLSSEIVSTLRASYSLQCGGYIILLRDREHMLHLLEFSEINQIVNMRGRFAIWYEGNDRLFESNDIWQKIPNLVFFHSKPRRHQTNLLFTVRQLKWPVPYGLSLTETRIRVIEFWGKNISTNGASQPWYFDKPSDLKNITLRIIIVEHPPAVIKYTNYHTGEVEYAGTEIQILKSLAKSMKFSYELHDVDPTLKWGGVCSGNNSECPIGRKFNGAISHLIYAEMDMGIGAFFILKQYLKYMDMSTPLEVVCTSFLTPIPLPRPRYLALILPFRFETWLSLIITSFLIGPIILYIFAYSKDYQTEYAIFRCGAQVFLTSFRLTSQVALHVWPKFWPIRLYIGLYWLFWFCVTSGYRAAMVAFLTIPLNEKPIDNMKDLMESGLPLGGSGIELHKMFLQHLQINSDLSVQYTTSNRERYELLDDLDEGINRVAQGKFALFENIRFLNFVRQTRNLSNLGLPTMRVMKQCVVPAYIGFAFQRNSPLTLTVNKYIRRFQESGLTKRWTQRLVASTKEYQKNHTTITDSAKGEVDATDSTLDSISSSTKSQKVFRLEELQGAVYILIMGYGISLATFITEIFYKKSKDPKIWTALDKQKISFREKVTNAFKILRTRITRHRRLEILDVRVRKPRKIIKLRKQILPFPYLE